MSEDIIKKTIRNGRYILAGGLVLLALEIIGFGVYRALTQQPPPAAATDPLPPTPLAEVPPIQPDAPASPPAHAPLTPTEAEAFTVEGTGFQMVPLETGGIAYSDRKYVWEEIPPRFTGWHYTQTAGGKPAKITVTAHQPGTLYVATGAEPGVDATGWEAVEEATFHYTDGKKTAMLVYRRDLQEGQTVVIPQGNWSSMLVLLQG